MVGGSGVKVLSRRDSFVYANCHNRAKGGLVGAEVEGNACGGRRDVCAG